MKDFDQAIIDYDKAIELNPELAVAYYNRGIIFFEMKKYSQAIEGL